MCTGILAKATAVIDLHKYGAPAGCSGYNLPNIVFTMRQQTLRDQIATLIQVGHITQRTSDETAERILRIDEISEWRALTNELAIRLTIEGHSVKTEGLLKLYDKMMIEGTFNETGQP